MMKSNRGFTLVELMITVAMMSIVMAVGLPSFKSIIDDSRLTSTANAMLSAYQIAKTEAIKRHQTVTVSSSDEWKSWIVTYTELENGQKVTKTIAFESSKSVTIEPKGTVIGFEASGRQEGGGSCGTGNTIPPDCGFVFSNADGSNKRYLVISNTGKMKVLQD